MLEPPATLRPVLTALTRVGRPRLVGGCVRDALLGRAPEDWDVEIGGTDFDSLLKALRQFGSTDVVGRSFGTIKLRREGAVFDFSLPRRESKTGAGHRGFKVEPDPHLSDADAAARRDFTLNAIAWDPATGELIDPHGGQKDLANRILRHTSEAFVEDPLRVLRGMQFVARFDLEAAPETLALCRRIHASCAELPRERIWGEWDKWAVQSATPSRGLRFLHQAGWLQHFPEIDHLRDTLQDPEWHPEGDVFVHTCHGLDALVRNPHWATTGAEDRRLLMFAVLAHDFGKPATTHQAEKRGQFRWTSPGHATAGLNPTETFLARIGAPHRLRDTVLPLVKYHMVHIDAGEAATNPSFLRRLARKLAPASMTQLATVMRADARGRPPLDATPAIRTIDEMTAAADALAIADGAPQPILLGRHLIERGLSPGPEFKPLLQDAFEAQLSGAFNDEDGSLKWLDAHLKLRAK
ncbi:CCA tRNA nucleotidyltransferase [Actomonas aquatica]|uniref:HD domain-containing protein n=1 Tax=Actomonas aquatica TaxID=2866162 RepID=A0ABZ1CED5_9BACT|nr:HD domain-containing protein [Opitutus sp. WL0086]WRQ89777.1 HD domain-containing protein [Opitutus sp. WL0086]